MITSSISPKLSLPLSSPSACLGEKSGTADSPAKGALGTGTNNPHIGSMTMGHDNPGTSFDETHFWEKVRTTLGHIPFMDEVLAAYFCAIDRETPTRVRGTLLTALAYFVLPMDVIPDFILGFGFTDDATVLATAIGIVSGHIKERHLTEARLFLKKSAA